jgi:hypothetical protein
MSSPESVPSTVIVVLAGSSAVIIRTISHYLSGVRSAGSEPNRIMPQSLEFVCTCGASTAPGVRRCRQRVTSCRGKCRSPTHVEGLDQVEVERAVMRTHLRRRPRRESLPSHLLRRALADVPMDGRCHGACRHKVTFTRPNPPEKAARNLAGAVLMQNPNRTIAGVQGCPPVSRKRGWL